MEILIQVPPFLQSTVEILYAIWTQLQDVSHWLYGLLVLARSSANELFAYNVFWPILAVIMFFWPVLVYMIMSITAAWTWIFWLVTSILLGVVQLLYASYQFMMISFDICGLSTMKTYTAMRHQLLNILDLSMFDGKRRKISRRRRWRQQLDQADSYERFLKIRIEPKPIPTQNQLQTTTTNAVDAALPPPPGKMKRSTSWNHTPDHPTPTDTPRGATTSTTSPSLSRTRSFSGDVLSKQEQQQQQELLHHHDPIVVQELGQKTADLLLSTTIRLEEARLSAQRHPEHDESRSTLQYLLSGVVKRNHLNIDDLTVDNSRSIAEMGQYGLSTKSRNMIRNYFENVDKGLDWIADAPLLERNNNNDDTIMGLLEQHHRQPTTDLQDRITLIRKMKQNMGRTALMLSGGGAQAMYHLGVIRALIESKLYNDIKVISGTSGGSITAGMCAIKTDQELYADVCVSTVSTDYLLNGKMKEENIRWFPPIWDMASYWLKNKLLVDSDYFQRTCEFYFKDYTFEEAFVRTGKHVCITVSASRVATAQRLLLNHISTPHVTIASAVRASCALPGVMAPAKLMAKNSNGKLEPFEVDGVEWIDGSVQADLPFQRIATLFAVTSFIVSQTNFHVVPFLNKAHHPNQKSYYWRLFQTLEWDIRSRALKLSRLGLFPRMFGQDISKVFKQKYHGNLTIVPRFTTMQTFGLKALSNPTVKDMEGYLKHGQLATWPYLNAIREMMRLEKSLDDCLARLEARMRKLDPDMDWSNQDEIDSIASSSAHASTSRVRIIGRPPSSMTTSYRETEKLRHRLSGLERENYQLRMELERLTRSRSNEQNDATQEESSEENDDDPPNNSSSNAVSEGTEGVVWSLVRNASM